MTAVTDVVRDFIQGGGDYKTEVTSGFNLSTGAEVVGLQIKTKGRVKPLTRWKKEFTFYAKGDQTLTDLYRILGVWLSPASSEAVAP